MIRKKRVVITGMGLITPIGIGKDEFWSALISGRSGIKEINSFDTSFYSSRLGAEISGFNPQDFIEKKTTGSLDKASQFGLAAAKMALEDARLELKKEEREKAGVIIGTTTSVYNSCGDEKTGKTIPNIISGEFSLGGSSVLLTTSCAAGTYAVGESFDCIRYLDAEIMLAGGLDTLLEISHCGFSALRSLAKKCCSPFDRRRSGLVIGEGACVLILESLEHALNRNANIYAEISGYGLNCNASHITSLDINGEEAANSIRAALLDAGIKPKDVDYINAHGTGTVANDLMETNAIKKAFGDYAYKIPASSIKSMLGHSFGAAGAIEAATCALVIGNGILPPTINYEEPDPACDLDYVPNSSRKKEVGVALSNSFAFGGVNSCLVFSKYRNK